MTDNKKIILAGIELEAKQFVPGIEEMNESPKNQVGEYEQRMKILKKVLI